MNKDKTEEIDIFLLVKLMLQNKKQVLAFWIGAAVIGVMYSMLCSPIYYSRADIYIDDDKQIGNVSDTNFITYPPKDTNSYVELIRLPVVKDVAVAKMQPANNEEKEVLYDLLSEGLKIELARGTSLISITAKGRTPEEAQKLVNCILDSYFELLTEKKRASLVREKDFLEKQLDVTKKDIMTINQQLLNTPLDESSTSYWQLQLDLKANGDIYARLLKEWKTALIREQQVDDVQVISSANLPAAESGPHSEPGKFTAIGFAIGIILSIGYGLFLYWKNIQRSFVV